MTDNPGVPGPDTGDAPPGRRPPMLRDTACQYCEQDVYLVFHPMAGSEHRVEATCYNPQCPSRQSSPNEPHPSGPGRPWGRH